jgi:hypothetical protein
MKRSPQHDDSLTPAPAEQVGQDPTAVPAEDPIELEYLNLALCMYEHDVDKTDFKKLEEEIVDASSCITDHLSTCTDNSKHRTALVWLRDRCIEKRPRAVSLIALGDVLLSSHGDEAGARSCYEAAGACASAQRRITNIGKRSELDA